MTDSQRIYYSRVVRDCYLYPYGSKNENIIRGMIWLISWGVGIALQKTTDPGTLSGAYFIFALSLMSEFLSENKKRWPARILHGVFCLFTCLILFGSLMLSIQKKIPVDILQNNPVILWIIDQIPGFTSIICIRIAIGVVISFFEPHKMFFDEERQEEIDVETKRKEQADIFVGAVNGTQQGGDAK